MKIDKTEIGGHLKGRVRVVGPDGDLLFGLNSLTDAALGVMRGLIMRNFRDNALTYVALGDGGDCEKDPPHNDTGVRVAPDPSETEMRKLIEKITIQTSRIDGDDVVLVAVARPEQAQGDINEFGLLTADDTLFAHFVTEADLSGKAKKYPKTDIYWIVEWPIEYFNV